MTDSAVSDTTTRSSELSDRVRELLRERLFIDVPGDATDLFSTGIIDSLGFVELLIGLEQEWGVHVNVDDLDMDDLRSIERIALFVAARRD